MGSEAVQIVTAVLVFLGVCVTAWQAVALARLKVQQEQAADESRLRGEAAARKVAEVVSAAKTAVVETKAIAEQLTTLTEKVEVVHKATNSLTDRLVASTADAAHAAGVKEERDRTDAVAPTDPHEALAPDPRGPLGRPLAPSPEPPRRPPP